MEIDRAIPDRIPAALQRAAPFLTHPVFHSYRSETEMLRYMRLLADKDLALDRAMIPRVVHHEAERHERDAAGHLGDVRRYSSLRAARPSRRISPADWSSRPCCAPAPATMRCRCSPIPARRVNSPVCWRSATYHASRGEDHRNVCLIPSSAHGTNPASAQMAGLKVVVVQCDKEAMSTSRICGQRPRSTAPTWRR